MTATIDRLLSVEEARAGVLAAITGPVGTETIATADALGRVLAEPVVARVSLPPWDNSAMDGYAVRAADTVGASEEHPVRLVVTGDVPAGKAATGTVGPGGGVPDCDRCADPARRRRGRPGRSHDATRHGRHARSSRPRCHGSATGRLSRPRTS